MSRFGIIVNVDKCVGCHACAIACKEENQVAPGIFYERVERFENIAANFINWFRVSCMHCDKARLYAGLSGQGYSPRPCG